MNGPMSAEPGLSPRVARYRSVIERHSTLVGLGVSAVLHVIFILLYAVGLNRWGPTEAVVAVQSPSTSFSSMRVVRLVEITTPEEPPPEAVEAQPEPEPVVEAAAARPAVGPADVGGGDEEDGPSGPRASEVLRVRSSDARLWREAQPELYTLTEVELIRLRLAGRLEEWADSVSAAMAAEEALTDWTTTDAEGRRWGVSPGKIHLGDVTLPMPFYFRGNSWQREQAMLRAWEEQSIINGASGAAARASWRERAEAIRRRKNRERREAEVQPDTTGSSRRR
jgi:hypothetical protein